MTATRLAQRATALTVTRLLVQAASICRTSLPRCFVILAISGLWGVTLAAQIVGPDAPAGHAPNVSVEISPRLSPPPVSLPALGASVVFRFDPSGAIVGRRVLSYAADRRSFGYAVVLEPQTKLGAYTLSFRDLTAAEMDVPDGDPAIESPQKYPAARAVAEGDRATVEVAALAIGNKRTLIMDEIAIRRHDPLAQAEVIRRTDQRLAASSAAVLGEILRRGLKSATPAPPTLTAAEILSRRLPLSALAPPTPRSPLHSDQPRRAFTVADAEFHLADPTVAINGGPDSSAKSVHGSLIFVYIPTKGRYILSLLSRPELGFVEAGAVSGGLLKWTANGESFSVRSTAEIVPAGGPFFVYGMIDSGWKPVAPATSVQILTGSVDVDEIKLLQKEAPK